MIKSKKNKFILLLFLVQITIVFAQDESAESTEASIESSSPVATENSAKFEFLNNKTFVRDPFNLRDPFKRVDSVKKTQSESKYKVDKNTFTNVKALGNVSLENLAIVGIFVGKERRALARVKDGASLGTDVFIIKEGMIIGNGSAEVKAILPGGIAIVEKITNVYNQDEYIETIIPVYSD